MGVSKRWVINSNFLSYVQQLVKPEWRQTVVALSTLELKYSFINQKETV